MKISKIILLAASVGLMSACGGGGGGAGDEASSGGTATQQGVFIDSAVQGIRYESGALSGITDASGAFQYESGNSVRFYVGDVLLGEVKGSSTITPVELVSGAADETNPTVTNIARFLQTLDDDGDPSNGIVITDTVAALAAGKSIDFTQDARAFTAQVQTLVAEMTAATNAGARNLVTVSAAQDHLASSLLKALAGSWSGSFTGSESGTWSVTISPEGRISGSGTSNTTGSFAVSGSINTRGTAAFGAGSTSGGARFNGDFDYTSGTASGRWDGGTWSGSKQ